MFGLVGWGFVEGGFVLGGFFIVLPPPRPCRSIRRRAKGGRAAPSLAPCEIPGLQPRPAGAAALIDLREGSSPDGGDAEGGSGRASA